MSSPSGRRLAALAVLLAVPLALRLLPIRHGSPRNYLPDTHMVRQSLAMARDHDLAPKAGQYSFYPNLIPYLLLPVYAGEYALGKARGSWDGPKQFGEHLLDHPEDAQIPARVLVALFGALTTLVVFGTARAAGLRLGAWVAAWLAATSLLSVQLSTHERPWAPMTFFLALACWPTVLYARSGQSSRLLASGAFAGLAAACHQGGLLALAIPGLAWLLGPLEWRRGDLARRLRQGASAVAVFLAVALLVGYPHFVRYGFDAVKVAGGEEQVAEQGGIHVGGLSVVFGVRWESFTRLARAILGYDPAIVALGLGGLAFGFARRELRAPLLFVFAWAAFFMTNKSDHVRYLLPVVTILCWSAGAFAEEAQTHKLGKVVLFFVLLFPFVQASRFAWVLSRPDTRAEAEERLARLEPGTVVAIDRYGPDVDLDRNSLQRLLRVRASLGEGLREREDRRRLVLDGSSVPESERGIDAVRVEEIFEIDPATGMLRGRTGLESLGDDPKKILGSLGVTHFLLVERRPSDEGTSPFRSLARAGKPVWVIDPARGFGPPKEAFLPTEMDFPATALWAVERPGPLLELRDLR
jgi:hypothetical protein